MKITYIILSICLALLILYFLFNVYFFKNTKLNNLLKISNKKDTVKFLFFSLLLVPLLGLSINNHRDQLLAESLGFDSFSALQTEQTIAKNYGLSLDEYQNVMIVAKKAKFTDYVQYKNYLTATENGYNDYQEYYSDLQFSRSYDLPLAIYKKAKDEAKTLNYEFFDDYLIHKEKDSLKNKLALINNLSGNYTIENVPLGVNKDTLITLVDDCKIDKTPAYSFPLTKTLAPRNQAYVNHFFPATKETDSGFGLTAYSMNFTVMPGLDLQAISKYEMKCETNRYELWFLNSDDSLVLYEKTITFPQNNYKATLAKIEKILNDKCDTDITVGLDMTFEENGERSIKNFYCKSFQDYILATIVDGPIITGVRQDPSINIGYLNNRLWKKYINNLHAIKGKKKNNQMSRAQNAQKTIEDRI